MKVDIVPTVKTSSRDQLWSSLERFDTPVFSQRKGGADVSSAVIITEHYPACRTHLDCY